MINSEFTVNQKQPLEKKNFLTFDGKYMLHYLNP